MTAYRLNRLFDTRSGRLLDVAIDYGLFGETRYLSGVQDLATVVETLVGPGPDAMQLSVGQAHLLQARPGRHKPSLVLRADVTNTYGDELPDELFSLMVDDPVEQALRLDAACVAVNLFDIPGHPDLRRECTANILELQPRCAAVGMPLMIEPLVMRWGHANAGYEVEGDALRVTALVRQAVELGADIVQADTTDQLLEYYHVIEAAGTVPVLVRSGGQFTDQDVLLRTRAVLDQGARGIVIGHNLVEHPAPVSFARALLALIHQNVTAEEAMAMIEIEGERVI